MYLDGGVQGLGFQGIGFRVRKSLRWFTVRGFGGLVLVVWGLWPKLQASGAQFKSCELRELWASGSGCRQSVGDSFQVAIGGLLYSGVRLLLLVIQPSIPFKFFCVGFKG